MAEETLLTATETPDAADASETEGAPKAEETKQEGTEQAADNAEKDEAEGNGEQQGDEGEGDKSDVPESYELKLPEGSQLTDADLAKTEELAKEFGLSNENAQKLLESRQEAVSDYVQSMQEQVNQQVDQWANDVKADKELGGDNFEQTSEHAKRVLDRFATDEFKSVLNDTGYGNHPELVRVFARVGKAMADDDFVAGNSSNEGDPEQRRLAAMYPSMVKEQ